MVISRAGKSVKLFVKNKTAQLVLREQTVAFVPIILIVMRDVC